MRKLYWLLPIGMWIASYFIWTHSALFIKEQPDAAGIWWSFTDVICIPVIVFLFFYALDNQ